MRPTILSCFLAFILSLFFAVQANAQTFGTTASAIWISNCSNDQFYNTSGTAPNLIGSVIPADADMGVYTQNSNTLILRGAEVRTFKVPGVSNVCGVRMYYRVYKQAETPGSFTAIALPFLEDCNVPTLQYPSGGVCVAGNQKWQRIIANGTTSPYAPVNLTAFSPGNYVLEVYYDVTGSSTSASGCDETILLNNSGENYKANFSIQAPSLASNNPVTCNGTEGSITINGLVAGATYSVSYFDDGVSVGPNNYVANGSGQVIIGGLNAGIYLGFDITINDCTTELNTGLILSNPILTPRFSRIAPFCAGTTAPTLPTTSTNGISGTWSPAVIDNQTSGSYTFTPNPNQCGLPITINVTVIPRTVPTFSFGTSLSICAGATVPSLPTVSSNGISGTWSPAAIDNQNSAVYTFTPASSECASPTTLTVTVAPNITPTFSFGTSLGICAGATVPALPTTSGNGITGTWSPAAIDNQNSAVYTFTPTTGLCATTTSLNVTVTPNTTPVFSFGSSLSICAGGAVPTLPTTSSNGVTGTWSPASVDNNTSGVYTFTPTAGLCALQVTFTVTVAPNITPAFSFGSSLTICAGGTVPTLPTTSTNSITGTWSPSIVDNNNSGVYTFTPTAGQCATTASFTVTVNPYITPVFSFGTAQAICAGATPPSLPVKSDNGITGTWNPAAVDNTNSAVYTFTPDAGQCATTTSLTVTVKPIVTPTFSFGNSLVICAGAAVPTLPTTSANAITGTWSPATESNQTSGTYTFTPTGGQCATTTTFTVTVTPNVVPTFSFRTSLTICAGGTVPTLPTSSTNSINGSWSPATVNSQNSATYTFTPAAGVCATTTTFSVTVNPNVTPTFSFGTAQSICAGASVPTLPTTSANGITGTWSPATVDNQNSNTYTFTPTTGLCAVPTTFTVTVGENILPTFNFGTTLTICAGGPVPTLATTSGNGITGTWNAATVSNQTSAVYTFTPAGGQCATTTTFTVTVNPVVTPTFSFGGAQTICRGDFAPTLPTTSSNGVSGNWSPSVVDNQNSATYTFTPTSGLCANSITFTVTVNPVVNPTFAFGSNTTICSGKTAPILPTTSSNAVTGTWSPAIVDNQNSNTYTFTPTAGQCATATTFTVIVTPSTTPVFDFGTELTICTGADVPVLPSRSTNGIDGVWSAATIDKQNSAVYTFTPSASPDQCINTTTLTVTVNPILTPTFSFGTTQTICAGATAPVLPTTSTNGIKGTWSPATVSNQTSGTYTFTSDAGQCAAPTATLTVTVNPLPVVAVRGDTTVNDGALVPGSSFTSSPSGAVFNWTNSNTTIGLAASGTGSVPAFTANNKGATNISSTITVTPVLNGCTGAAKSYVITVRALDKDLFVPNVFSPNGDGKNDLLLVYGNYISQLDMRIYNQWGQQVAVINNSSHKSWDGTFHGKPQPVAVYVYELQATMTDGKIIKRKGNITLMR